MVLLLSLIFSRDANVRWACFIVFVFRTIDAYVPANTGFPAIELTIYGREYSNTELAFAFTTLGYAFSAFIAKFALSARPLISLYVGSWLERAGKFTRLSKVPGLLWLQGVSPFFSVVFPKAYPIRIFRSELFLLRLYKTYVWLYLVYFLQLIVKLAWFDGVEPEGVSLAFKELYLFIFLNEQNGLYYVCKFMAQLLNSVELLLVCVIFIAALQDRGKKESVSA